MSLIPAANYGSPNETYFITRQDVINPLPIPGPAGPQGAVGPAGPQGLQGVNSFGSWYYAAMGPLPPAPQTVQWNGTDIYFSLVSIPPGGSDWLYSLKTQFQSISTVTLYINSTDIGGNDIGWTASITAVNFFESLGYAQFTYVPASPIPIGFVAGNVVRVFDGGGSIGPVGPAGPAGPQGPQGIPGTDSTVAIGTTTTLAPGSAATVSNSGTPSAAILNFGIPQGAQGDPATASTWSQYPATQQVEMGNQILNNVQTVNTGSLGTTNIDCYQTTVTGYGRLQVGSPLSIAPNPGTVNVNGTLAVQRGFSNFYANALGIEFDGTSSVPANNSVKFGCLPVLELNTCRFEMNTITSPSAITMAAPSYITIDAVGAANIAAGGAVAMAAGGTVTLESGIGDITFQGSSGASTSVHMTGGTLDGMDAITGKVVTGVAVNNVTSVNALSGANLALTSTSGNLNITTKNGGTINHSVVGGGYLEQRVDSGVGNMGAQFHLRDASGNFSDSYYIAIGDDDRPQMYVIRNPDKTQNNAVLNCAGGIATIGDYDLNNNTRIDVDDSIQTITLSAADKVVVTNPTGNSTELTLQQSNPSILGGGTIIADAGNGEFVFKGNGDGTITVVRSATVTSIQALAPVGVISNTVGGGEVITEFSADGNGKGKIYMKAETSTTPAQLTIDGTAVAGGIITIDGVLQPNNGIRDVSNSTGTANQVLTASPLGSSLIWQSLPLIWGCFSSSITQNVSGANTTTTIGFTTTQVSNNCSLGGGGYTITTSKACSKMRIQASIIASSTSPSTKFRFWLMKDGANVANSCSEISIKDANDQVLCVCEWFETCVIGTTFRILYQSDNANGRILAVAAGGSGANSYPATPCIILTFQGFA